MDNTQPQASPDKHTNNPKLLEEQRIVNKGGRPFGSTTKRSLELNQHALKDKVINRSWELIHNAIKKKSLLSREKQIYLAKEICVKDLSRQLNPTGNKETKIIIIKPASAEQLNPIRIINTPIIDSVNQGLIQDNGSK